MTPIRNALIAAVAGVLALPALAETAPGTGTGHSREAPTEVPAGAIPAGSDQAYAAALDKMHTAMMIAPTGDADVDFVRSMIPHHQGAIDMARIQLEFGDEPELRQMSEAIIAAQEDEIARMQEWLAKNAPDAANADAAKMESLTANPATGAPPAAE